MITPPIDTHFDEEFADALARLESYNKHLHRPNTYLHKWWARRCGSTFRLILKALVADEAARDYYAAGGLDGKIILDPMMGGGTTLHEAIRLGASVIGADVDPIPVLQARASLTAVSTIQLAQQFRQFQQTLRSELGDHFRTTCPQCARDVALGYVLYGLRRRCDCGESLFVDSLILRHNNSESVFHLDPATHDVCLDNEIFSAAIAGEKRPLRERTLKSCPTCHKAYREILDVPYYQRYVPLAVNGRCPEHGLFFAAMRPADWAAIRHADALRPTIALPAEEFTVGSGSKSRSLIERRVDNYLDLFSSRQLLYLTTAVKWLNQEISDLGLQISEAARLNLALLVSTSLEFNTLLCGYKGYGVRRPGAIRHAFTYHAYSFPYTALENNPLARGRASGTLENLFNGRILRARQWAKNPVERRPISGRRSCAVPIVGEVDAGTEVARFDELGDGRRFLLIQGSSTRLDLPDDSVDFIVTDPPYFDSVQYSDLAAFFRVWLRQLLPENNGWSYELDQSAVEPNTNGSGADYTTSLSGIFAECARVLKKENGRLIFTYHHWNPKGWAALTLALKRAGFGLVNRYVVHAENLASRHIVGQNALIHDVILVCAPAQEVGRAWDAVTAVTLTDSYQFCYDCGSVLGWLLTDGLSEGEIESAWRELLT
jgi:putative DNA methylase